MIWAIVAASALALTIFFERLLLYHSEQINSTEFLNGVRNVLKRDNVVEAIAICDATPGPVARLVKVAIVNRERGREAVREALEDAGAWEVPRLEQKLNLLATIAQIAPLLGLLGTVLGFMNVFKAVQDSGLNAHIYQLSEGVWQALICTAAASRSGRPAARCAPIRSASPAWCAPPRPRCRSWARPAPIRSKTFATRWQRPPAVPPNSSPSPSSATIITEEKRA